MILTSSYPYRSPRHSIESTQSSSVPLFNCDCILSSPLVCDRQGTLSRKISFTCKVLCVASYLVCLYYTTSYSVLQGTMCTNVRKFLAGLLCSCNKRAAFARRLLIFPATKCLMERLINKTALHTIVLRTQKRRLKFSWNNSSPHRGAFLCLQRVFTDNEKYNGIKIFTIFCQKALQKIFL